MAVTLGAGGFGLVSAAVSSGERLTFVAITPCRLLDTRAGSVVLTRQTPLGAGETYTQNAHGNNGLCSGIPTDATALSLNVTAINATVAGTFLTFWPTGAPRPDASSLNPAPGQPPTPNAVITDISAAGQFDIFNFSGSVDLLVDVNGYYVDHNHDDRYYTKPQVDAAVGTKANAADVYTKGQVDAAVGTKANATDVYTKAQIDQRIPKVDYLSIPSSAFRPTTDSATFVEDTLEGAVWITGGAVGRLSAPVSLPDGATVTEVVVHFRDNTPDARLEVTFRCTALPSGSTPALGEFRSSANLPGWQTGLMPLSPFKVNNTTCAYLLDVDAIFDDAWPTYGELLKFKSVVVRYERPG
jgi:hypothetical protein